MERLVSTAAVRSTIFLKVRRTCIINMGKKMLVCNGWKKESVTIELYNSITSSAAKVKEDPMSLAC